jgi:hypothetical protein
MVSLKIYIEIIKKLKFRFRFMFMGIAPPANFDILVIISVTAVYSSLTPLKRVNILSFRSDMCANEMVDLQYTILTVLLIIPFYRINNKP